MQPIDRNQGTISIQQAAPSSQSSPVRQYHQRDSLHNNGRATDESCCDILQEIFKIVVDIIKAPLIFIYDFLKGMLCPDAESLRVSEEALAATQGMRINPARLAAKPEPIALNELELNNISVEFNEIVTLYDEIFTRPDHGMSAEVVNHARQYIVDYSTYVERGPHPTTLYTQNIQGFAKNIIFEMKKPDEEVPLAKKITALLEIADACEHCRPRRYEESKRQYLLLTNRMTTIDQQILTWLQMLKDDIIIQAFQHGQFHVINAARNMQHLARKWGLDNEDQCNIDDEYIGCGRGFSEWQADATLEANYFPARLVDSIKARLDTEANNDTVNNYLANCNNLPDDYATTFYEVDRTADPTGPMRGRLVLNCKGVAFLLKELHFLA